MMPEPPRTNAGTTNDWVVQLDCGHDLSVPWGSVVPFVIASCVVRHQESCGAEDPEATWGPSWVAPISAGVGFR